MKLITQITKRMTEKKFIIMKLKENNEIKITETKRMSSNGKAVEALSPPCLNHSQ